MRTTYRIREPFVSTFLQCADDFVCNSPARPVRFIRKMMENTGTAGAMYGFTDENGLERKNPVIVALGDSVTAGHFESLITPELVELLKEAYSPLSQGGSMMDVGKKMIEMGGLPPMEITDARESYIEKFREKLIDKYENTSVSVINAGIAGDFLPSMIAHSERDVIRYQPDLILINGSLNWDDQNMGDENVYKQLLQQLVRTLKEKTEADIILLTPNGDTPVTVFADLGYVGGEPTTWKRCEKIREVAEEEKVCLADARAVWDAAKEKGCAWEELLANKVNHPSVEGHEVYARVLMKLFE